MKKVYIIRYEETCSGEYSSGVCYVFDTLEKAKIMLEEIKKEYQKLGYIIRELEEIEKNYV